MSVQLLNSSYFVKSSCMPIWTQIYIELDLDSIHLGPFSSWKSRNSRPISICDSSKYNSIVLICQK